MHKLLISVMLWDVLGAGRQLLLLHNQTSGAGLEQPCLERLWLRVLFFISLLKLPAAPSLSQETQNQEYMGQMPGSLGHYWDSGDTVTLHEIGCKSLLFGKTAAGSLLKNSFLIPGKLKTC